MLQFVLGLALCAVAVWLSLQVQLGLAPWDVLHHGVSKATGASFGTVVAGVGVLVLAVSALFGVRPGAGTLANVAAIAVALDWLLGTPWFDTLGQQPVALRVAALIVAVALLGLGGALYIGSGFGAGPRDSLMVACHQHGIPIGLGRCGIEVSVLGLGWLLQGSVGVGTLVIAFGSGPAVQASFRLIRQQPPTRRPRPR